MADFEVVTGDQSSNEQLVYFTSSSLDAKDRTLFYISDRGGSPNLYSMDLESGRAERLSDNGEGPLKSYVYFRGNPYHGFGKASVAVDSPRGIVYWIEGQTVFCSDRSRGKRSVAKLPEGRMTGFTHVSVDGRLICIPTVDERALEDDPKLPLTRDGCGKPSFDVDRRIQDGRLSSYLHIYNTETGREEERIPVPSAWVTHVQFSPLDNGTILYNHEWPCFGRGSRRLWLYRNGAHLRLRPDDGIHNPLDWTYHEMWEPSGRRIVYHGSYFPTGRGYIGLVRDDLSLTELPLPLEFTHYGHFTMGNLHPELLVTDGYYRDEEGHDDWISLLKVDWEAGSLSYVPLCRHGSPWTTQDTHPHPIFDHRDRYVYFTGMVGNVLKVCRVSTGL